MYLYTQYFVYFNPHRENKESTGFLSSNGINKVGVVLVLVLVLILVGILVVVLILVLVVVLNLVLVPKPATNQSTVDRHMVLRALSCVVLAC